MDHGEGGKCRAGTASALGSRGKQVGQNARFLDLGAHEKVHTNDVELISTAQT